MTTTTANNLTHLVIAFSQEVQRIGVAIQRKKIPHPMPEADPSPLVIAQLASMFNFHGGFIPPFELIAEGFDPAKLEAQKLIYRSGNHLEGGCYTMGIALEEKVFSTGR